VLFEGKFGVSEEVSSNGEDQKSFGTLAAVTGRDMGLTSYLPDWLEDGIESSLRDTPDDGSTPEYPQATSHSSAPRIATSMRATPVILTPTGTSSPVLQNDSKGAFADLDSFYNDTQDVEPETESEESEEDESSEGEEEEASEDEASSENGDTNGGDTNGNAVAHDSPR